MICNYCKSPAQLVTGREVYPHRRDLYDRSFYRCTPCGAYVGCHLGTDKPLGGLANKELRDLRKRAHAAFDPLWKSGLMTRSEAYAHLAHKLHIALHECHIGQMREGMCLKVIKAMEIKG